MIWMLCMRAWILDQHLDNVNMLLTLTVPQPWADDKSNISHKCQHSGIQIQREKCIEISTNMPSIGFKLLEIAFWNFRFFRKCWKNKNSLRTLISMSLYHSIHIHNLLTIPKIKYLLWLKYGVEKEGISVVSLHHYYYYVFGNLYIHLHWLLETIHSIGSTLYCHSVKPTQRRYGPPYKNIQTPVIKLNCVLTGQITLKITLPKDYKKSNKILRW